MRAINQIAVSFSRVDDQRKGNRVTGNTASRSYSAEQHLNLDELPWIGRRRSINHGAARDDAAAGGNDIDDRNLFHDVAERV